MLLCQNQTKVWDLTHLAGAYHYGISVVDWLLWDWLLASSTKIRMYYIHYWVFVNIWHCLITVVGLLEVDLKLIEMQGQCHACYCQVLNVNCRKGNMKQEGKKRHEVRWRKGEAERKEKWRKKIKRQRKSSWVNCRLERAIERKTHKRENNQWEPGLEKYLREQLRSGRMFYWFISSYPCSIYHLLCLLRLTLNNKLN